MRDLSAVDRQGPLTVRAARAHLTAQAGRWAARGPSAHSMALDRPLETASAEVGAAAAAWEEVDSETDQVRNTLKVLMSQLFA